MLCVEFCMLYVTLPCLMSYIVLLIYLTLYGLKISVYFVCQGHVKGVSWIKKKIDEPEKKVQALFEKCMKESPLYTGDFLPLG